MQKSSFIFPRLFIACVAGAVVSACSSSGSQVAPIVGVAPATPVPVATPTPIATPTPVSTAVPVAQHLYVGGDEDGFSEFTLPVTSSSKPVFTNVEGFDAVAVDANGDLISGGGAFEYFAAPVTATSTPVFFGNDATQVAFLNSGSFLGTRLNSNAVSEYAPPFSSASVPSATITNAAFTSTSGLAVDGTGTLYVSNYDNAGVVSNIVVLTPPYTGTATVTAAQPSHAYVALALNSTQLFAVNEGPNGIGGSVDVFTLPITASSTPAFSIGSPLNGPNGAAFDAAGNLYVSNGDSGFLDVYAPPFSASSMPVATVHPFSDNNGGSGVAIGK